MRRITVCFFLCLILAGCGTYKADDGLSLLGRAADMDEHDVLLTIDDREIPAWRYLYWLQRACETMAAREQSAESSWSAETSDGGTLAEHIKEQALSDTALYATVEIWAEGYDCALTEEEQDALRRQWERTAAKAGGEAAYLAREGLSRQQSEELAAVGALYAKLYALYRQPDSLLAPVDGELAQFAQENGYISVDRLLVPFGDDRSAARQQAETLFSRLNSAADAASAFDDLAKEAGGGSWTFLPGDGMLDPALEGSAETLAIGQYSGILETEEGFSILRRSLVNEAALYEAHFDYLLQQAASLTQIHATAAYDSLAPEAFWQGLQALRSVET